jgi:hypothetical protein
MWIAREWECEANERRALAHARHEYHERKINAAEYAARVDAVRLEACDERERIIREIVRAA